MGISGHPEGCTCWQCKPRHQSEASERQAMYAKRVQRREQRLAAPPATPQRRHYGAGLHLPHSNAAEWYNRPAFRIAIGIVGLLILVLAIL